MSQYATRLYELLPAVYRERDASEGYPLRALLQIAGEQADLLHGSIEAFWNDQFIETCANWVVPYIGELVGNRLLFDAGRTSGDETALRVFTDLTGPNLRPPIAIRTRADVAKTIYYRRRKGTLPMLEELARDVTGWPAHAVEFFELLGWTQHMEHFRPQSQWTDVRSVDRTDRIRRPFDQASHTVDVRRIASDEGWHNIRNVGFFLFRLGAYPLGPVPARQASAPWRFHFSPLGNPAPLFSAWRREGDEAGLSTELHVPAPIRRPFFHEDLNRYRNLPPERPDFTDLYGLPDPQPSGSVTVAPDASLFILRNGDPILPAQDANAPLPVYQPQVVCAQLDPWPAAQPAGRIVAVDVHTGRIAVGDGYADATDSLDVWYHYGFSSDLGGGPYERQKWLVRPGTESVRLYVQEGATGAQPDVFGSVIDALNEWASNRGRADAVIVILDSRTYQMPAQITLRNEGFLVIEAANERRPLLQTQAAGFNIAVLPPAAGIADRQGSLTLSGVVVEGHLHVTGDLGRLRLLHSTLVPGRRLDEDGRPVSNGPSVDVEPGTDVDPLNTQLRVELAFSISGPLFVPAGADSITALDSIVDALDADANAIASGPPLRMERSTVIGRISVKSLELSESIVTGRIDTVRTQDGCVRFSYVRPGSRTPRRYRCQPDLAVDAAIEKALKRDPLLSAPAKNAIRSFVQGWLVPSFTTSSYGLPAYAQLRLRSPLEIRTGADDGSEMGAFCHLKQPQRESNLRLRLGEYLPFGLEAGIIYAT